RGTAGPRPRPETRLWTPSPATATMWMSPEERRKNWPGIGDGPGGGEAGAVGVRDQGGMTPDTRAATLARSAVPSVCHALNYRCKGEIEPSRLRRSHKSPVQRPKRDSRSRLRPIVGDRTGPPP